MGALVESWLKDDPRERSSAVDGQPSGILAVLRASMGFFVMAEGGRWVRGAVKISVLGDDLTLEMVS